MLTIRIDNEIASNIAFLKQHKIKYTDIIREAIREPLNNKCKEFYKKEPYCPF